MALTKVTGGTISTTSNYEVGVITATKFVGPFEGAVTGVATGASKVITSVESSDTTCFPLFVNSSTDAYQAPKLGSNLTFNSSTGDLGATKVTAEQFVGNISGTGATFTTVDISGTLNYTHVTDVYSVGVATFQNNVQAGAGISVVGVSTFTNGVGIADSIFHTGDTDTYLSFGANTINLQAGGTTGLSVQSASVRVPTKLGINGAAPQSSLDVIANSSGYAVDIRGRSSDDTSEIHFCGNNSSPNYAVIGITTTGGGQVNVQVAGSQRVAITSAGHFLPNVSGTQNLGSTSKEWGDVYIADDKKLYVGSDQNISLYHTSSNGINHLVGHPGNMFYHSATNYFTDAAQSKIQAQFIHNSYCELRHAGDLRIRTSETGIDVTGEVKATQDYPDFRPTVDFNFAAVKKLDSRINYTRTGRASYYDEHGLLKIVNSNVPRFDHDPDTREPLGLLIEESRTNLITNSDAPGPNTANLGGSAQTNTTEDAITLPTGQTGTVRKFKGVASGGGIRFGDFSGTANTTYTGSLWIRTVSGTSAVSFDMNDGNVQNNIPISTQWKRLTATHSTNNTYRFIDVYFDNPVACYIWGVQIEEGQFVSSYIPTRGAAETRGADIVDIDGEDFTDFYNQTESTIISSHTLLPNVPNAENVYVYQIQDATTNHGIRVIDKNNSYGNVATGLVFHGGLSQFHFNNTTDSFTKDKVLVALSVKNNDFAASHNGGTVESDTSGTLATNFNSIGIGRYPPSGGYELNGHIQRFIYYPKQLSDSQLKTLTS